MNDVKLKIIGGIVLSFSGYWLLLLLFFSPLKLCGFDISAMTLEEKIGQLFMVYFEGDEANENAEKLLRETKIGGIILYNWANGLDNPGQVQRLCNGLQQLALNHVGIPLFIAADQEGGRVVRFEKGFTEFPGNAALGRTSQPLLAYEAAQCIGREIRSVGINFNLAPVADVNNNPKNPIIGIRSFGSDPEAVAQFSKESIKGYQNAGIIPCLKHFPGHGDVVKDSHKSLPVNSKTLSELSDMELYPYATLAKDAPAIMTAHILFPQIDPDNCATLSPIILKGILRERLNFRGVLVTDSLSMQGVLEGYNNLEQVVFKALEAGNDILLIGGRNLRNKMEGETHVDEVIRIFESLVHAVKAGSITEDRINESVKRILTLKEKAGLYKSSDFSMGVLRSEKHLSLAREIAYRSLLIKDWKLQESLSSKKVLLIAPKIVEAKIQESELVSLGKTTSCFFFNDLELTTQEYEKILDELQYADAVVFCTYNAWRNPSQSKLCKQIADTIPTICIAVCDPYDLDMQNNAIVKLATLSPTKCSFQVAAEWLSDKTSPLKISDLQALSIGEKIWHNECNHRKDQLTFWNEKEPFPSLGIGHFIWPPKEYQGPFIEGQFHKFIRFAKEQGVEVPSWLCNQTYSPWATRESFYEAFDSTEMQELRNFLFDTVSIQAKYMVQRLNHAFAKIVLAAPAEQRQAIMNNFFSVGRSSGGAYILVDYLNFKHEGTDLKERYKGEGWGLLQVLQELNPDESESSIEKRFADSAKNVLFRRIANSPNQAIEKTFFAGWSNRLETYYETVPLFE